MNAKLTFITLFCASNLFAGLGDLNNDGAITLDDCKMLASILVEEKELVAPEVADIDGDGKVTIVDAMRLHQSIGGLWIEPTGKIAPVPQLSQEERAYFAQYEELCDKYETMSPQTFLENFPAAPAYASTLDPQQCAYFPIIDTAFKLNAEQKALLKQQGMVVLSGAPEGMGFGTGYMNIFKKDLPVFFTSDALLDPLYKTYDEALKGVETAYMIPVIDTILSATAGELAKLTTQYGSAASWKQPLADAATFLIVARSLLKGTTEATGDAVADQLLQLVAEEKLKGVDDFFGKKGLAIDFSQFKPRGHYECAYETKCALSNYFKCMMWLGRADCAFVIDSTDLRMLRDFLLIHTCMKNAGKLDLLSKFNAIVSFFVGDVDGFTIEGLTEITNTGAFSLDAVIGSDSAALKLYSAIKRSGGGNQLILSQAMWKSPDADRPDLPIIGQISGQRFILDSYLLGRTVEWYVKGRNAPLLEEVPFCLGNNAATSVVATDINKYSTSGGDYKPYHSRLGASRVLFEKYPYWDRNLYTLWLDALRALSPDLPTTVPTVMRSRTWQEKQMNTQLASWAQLRHNTLLYAKQSYTGGITCFYPDGYVEPYPEFYRTIGKLVKRLGQFIGTMGLTGYSVDIQTWESATTSLAAMAETELAGEPLTSAQIAILNQMISTTPRYIGCGETFYDGWYFKLFPTQDECLQSKPCIADVHTIPPSDISPSNMVLHAATGDASFVIIQAATGNDCGTLYAGVVSSFYQRDETPIKRLTDSEWTTVLRGGTKPGVPAWFGKYVK